MITIDFKSCRLSLTFGFFFLVALTTLRDNTLGTLSLLFCIVHELGHLAAMSIFGIKLHSVSFYGAGIKISSGAMDSISKPARALIYLAGPLTNLLLALLFYGDARALNLSLAVFNLLPISYFDGGRLLSLVLSKRWLLTAFSILSYIAIAAIMILMLYNDPHAVTPSAIMTFLFIAISCILDT